MQYDHRATEADLPQSFNDGLRRVCRSRENLQHADATGFDPHAIGEGTAGVDRDAKRKFC